MFVVTAKWIVVTEKYVQMTQISKFETSSANRRMQRSDVIVRAQDVLIQPSDFAAPRFTSLFVAFRLTNSPQA